MESQGRYATGGKYDIYVPMRIRFPAEGHHVEHGDTRRDKMGTVREI